MRCRALIRGLAGNLTSCGASIYIAALLTVASPGAEAGQFVEFDNGAEGPARVHLAAYLAPPRGAGPHPAVVLLHGCGGFHAQMLTWADALSRWGYVALAVDSFGPRGIGIRCGGGLSDQTTDSYAALRYLAAKPFVAPARVAVMGFSMGGSTVFADLERGAFEAMQPQKFRAGISFYPDCRSTSGFMTVPVLLLTGDADNWTPASACEAMMAGQSDIGISRKPGDRSAVQLVVYPGAHHAFDVLDLSLFPSRGVAFEGHRIEYDEAATKDALEQVRRFLDRTLAEP
jgi:dienelactone hydrolase